MEYSRGGGYKIISPSEALNLKNSVIIIGTILNSDEIHKQIKDSGYPLDRVVSPFHEHSGEEYFDYFEPRENEIFVDAGCFNGQTALEFSKWANKGYKYIYSFEANPHLISDCETTFEMHKLKGEVIGRGLWDTESTLHFDVRPVGGSTILDAGKEQIKTTSLDKVLNGKQVTFIKMDIEGAEYKALIGARETINKYRPRLAICVYHKPEDILEIPALILKIQPNYKFALRQYDSSGLGAILYAF